MLALDNKVMQVVSEILSAHMTTMSIENSKEAHLWPLSFPMLVFRLQYVQDDTDSIFIVFADYPLVSICSISLNYTALLV